MDSMSMPVMDEEDTARDAREKLETLKAAVAAYLAADGSFGSRDVSAMAKARSVLLKFLPKRGGA